MPRAWRVYSSTVVIQQACIAAAQDALASYSDMLMILRVCHQYERIVVCSKPGAFLHGSLAIYTAEGYAINTAVAHEP